MTDEYSDWKKELDEWEARVTREIFESGMKMRRDLDLMYGLLIGAVLLLVISACLLFFWQG